MRARTIGLITLAWIVVVAARDLPVASDKGWQHARTGLVLRPTLLGLPRTRLIDNRTDERDVIAQFNDPAIDTSATVYVFQPAERSVALWFDRAEYALVHRQDTGGSAPASVPTPFAPPHATVTAGLRRVYTPNRLPNRSEGLAVMPLGNWLVVVRLTSTKDDPAALDARMSQLIGELGWPASATATPRAVQPVEPCRTKLKTAHAIVRPPDMMTMLLGSITANPPADAKPGAAEPADALWCRDKDQTPRYGVYCHPGEDGWYLMAIADAGRTVTVSEAPHLTDAGKTMPAFPSAKAAGYQPVLRDLGGEATLYATFDKLPQPAQVFDLIAHGTPVSRVAPNAGGKQNITINASQLPAK